MTLLSRPSTDSEPTALAHRKPRFGMRWIGVLAVAVMLASALPAAAASSRGDGREPANPLRFAYFVLHPVAKVVEWTVVKPINFVGEAITPVTGLANIERSGCHRERPPRGCAYERR